MYPVNYEGYGVDFGDIFKYVSDSTQEEFRSVCWNNDIMPEDYQTEDITVNTPANSDDFYMLFWIPTAYTVRKDGWDPIRTYTQSEANACLQVAIEAMIASMHNDYGMSDASTNELEYAVSQLIANDAGYSYEKGPWADLI